MENNALVGPSSIEWSDHDDKFSHAKAWLDNIYQQLANALPDLLINLFMVAAAWVCFRLLGLDLNAMLVSGSIVIRPAGISSETSFSTGFTP